jgi:hypothetical protein
MKRVITLLVMVLLSAAAHSQDNRAVLAPVIEAISSADAKNLAAHFNNTVELNLPGQENTFSASQGEMIMKDFFKKSPPDSFSLVRDGNLDDASVFAICSYLSGSLQYQVYVFLKKEESGYRIQKLNFEEKK